MVTQNNYSLSSCCYCILSLRELVLNVCNIYNFVFSQVSSQVLVKQWNNLVQTLVATVIADKPAAEKANDTELCAIAKRLTAVRTY